MKRAFTYNQSSADELLRYLTEKFNRLLDSLKHEESERLRLTRHVADLQGKIQGYHDFDHILATQDTLRDNENLRQRVIHLEKELSATRYEKDRLETAFEEMRKQVEERVPVIAEVERRRLELEAISAERSSEVRSLQEQLREALRKCAKLQGQAQGSEKRVRELEGELRSSKERMLSLRKLNGKFE